jgi:hemolysin III
MSQTRPAAQPPEVIEEFSLPLFAFTVLATLAGLLAILRFAAPTLWDEQFLAGPGHAAVVFLSISFATCLIEYFFHRYVLHMPAIPFLRRLYRQHTLHHGLTHVARKQTAGGKGILVIENNFPMTEPEQGEASFFPWYSLAVFSLILTPVLGFLQWVAPAFPWFLVGFPTLAFSLTLYEVLHAINHWAFEIWEPLIVSERWGWFWKPVYGFHLRHHAVIDCNESISGFLGLPVADWLFGTCVIPQTVYAEGEAWSAEKFQSPRPRWFIRRLDRWAETVVQLRRQCRLPGRSDPPLFPRRGDRQLGHPRPGLYLKPRGPGGPRGLREHPRHHLAYHQFLGLWTLADHAVRGLDPLPRLAEQP